MQSKTLIAVAGALGVATTQFVLAPTARAEATPLSIDCKATPAAGEWPEVEVLVNETPVASLRVTNSDYQTVTVDLPRSLTAGDRVDVRFTNDRYEGGEDRNLWVQSIESNGDRVDVSDSTTRIDRGSSREAALDGVDTLPGGPGVFWSGALRFTWADAISAVPDLIDRGAEAQRVAPKAAASSVFASHSFWSSAIPSGSAHDGNSAAMIKRLVSSSPGKASLNTTSYSTPIYTVDSSVARVRVDYDSCGGAPGDPEWLTRQWNAQFASVPVPAGARGASGEDSEIAIWSPSTDELWELWRFRKTPSGYSACWGGKISNASSSNGVHTYPFGVSASGLSLMGGTVRAEELKAGSINHAIAIGINAPRAGVMSWPANRSDGTSNDQNAIPEGTRLRLDPSLDVDSLHISSVAKTIAKAAQTYGFIVRDNTGGPIVVYGEDAEPYLDAGKPNPYKGLDPMPEYDWLANFPWDRLQVMPKDCGKP